MKPKNLVIVGGGLVGSLWGVLLRQRGYQVKILEKREDLRVSKEGSGKSINLVMTSRGLHGLDQAGLKEKALKLSVPVFGRMIHSKEGATVFQPYGQKEECNYSISRSELNKFLLTEAENAGAEIFFGRETQSVDFAQKKVICDFGGKKEEFAYDLLFGADGAGSAVRTAMEISFPEQVQHYVEWLGADYKELLMPFEKPGVYPLEKNALHIWPRGDHMMMALANLDGSFTMTIYLPQKGALSFSAINNEETVETLFESEFADAVPLMPNYVKEYLANAPGLLGTVRCSRWVLENSVALMGDAAHAVVPFFGQGMNCAFEDATCLVELMEKFGDSWESIFVEYDERRRPNANAIADMAIENFTEMRDKVGDLKFLLRKKVENWLEKEFPEKFKSRYGMVTYTLVPYATAKKVGAIHSRILDELCVGIKDPSEIDRSSAESLIDAELLPFLKREKVDLRRYK